MQTIAVDEIGQSPTLGFYVDPVLPPQDNYALIWRDASSVRWDEQSRRLYSLPIKGRNEVAYYKQIVAAVEREYGHRLEITRSTRFNDLPAEVEAHFTELRTR